MLLPAITEKNVLFICYIFSSFCYISKFSNSAILQKPETAIFATIKFDEILKSLQFFY